MIPIGENGPEGPSPEIYHDNVTNEIIDRFQQAVETEVFAGLKTNEILAAEGKLAFDGLAKTTDEARHQMMSILGEDYTDVFLINILNSYENDSNLDKKPNAPMLVRLIKSHRR